MRVILPTLALSGLFWTSFSSAQSTGTLIPGRTPRSSMVGISTDTVQMIGRFEVQPTEVALIGGRTLAACGLKRSPHEVTALLKASDRAQFGQIFKRMSPMLTRCLGEQQRDGVFSTNFKMPYSTIRGLFADARFARDGTPKLAPIEYTMVRAGSDWITSDPGQKVLLRTANCLAARYPKEVSVMLAAPPESTAETNAFGPVAAGLGNCLERGVTLSARRSSLRLALAVALNDRMVAETPGTEN